MIPEYLNSDCLNDRVPCKGYCGDSIKQAPTGRWYITIGHPGFNLPANNRNGYRSSKEAYNKMRKCGGKEVLS